MKRKTGSVSNTPPPAPVVVPLTNGIYVSNFNTICGFPVEEIALLQWCQTNKITRLFLYDMSSVWATSYTEFIAFYDRALTYGIKEIFAQRGSEAKHIGSAFNSTKSYNLANPTRRVHFGFENEFWNYNLTGAYSNARVTNLGPLNPGNVGDKNFPDDKGNIIYSQWIVAQTNIYNYAKSQGLKSEAYIGHLHDDVEFTSTSTIANAMIRVTDAIEISWYVTTAEFNSSDRGLNFLRDRLNALGVAGIAAGRKVNLNIIYAGTDALMGTWFAAVGNTLLKALNISVGIIKANPLSQLTSASGFYVAGVQGYSIARA